MAEPARIWSPPPLLYINDEQIPCDAFEMSARRNGDNRTDEIRIGISPRLVRQRQFENEGLGVMVTVENINHIQLWFEDDLAVLDYAHQDYYFIVTGLAGVIRPGILAAEPFHKAWRFAETPNTHKMRKIVRV